MIYEHYSLVEDSIWRWPNFTAKELSCSCCGEFYLDEMSMDFLQGVRDFLGKPLIINSAHRCAIHNARIGGAPMSQHKKIAFDISLRNQNPKDLYNACVECGFTTFGFYGTFLHTDIRPGRRWFTEEGKKTWNGLVTF